MTAHLQDRINAELSRLHTGGPLGLAVSGGGDSVALLMLATAWAADRGVALRVATVDHGLRPESGAEAEAVARRCAALSLPHQTLRWTDWNGRGNLQAEARAARRRLLSGWAQSAGMTAIALGHTMDDQAETFLMRLGRGSGVDGLSGMRPATAAQGMRWLRPLLGVGRAALRDWLTERGETWIDDPSNEDARFGRVRTRNAMADLAQIGVDAAGLAATADRMQDAREALDHGAGALAAEAARWGACGELYLSLAPLRAAPPELRRRLVRAALTRAAGADYGPRADAEQKLLTAMLSLRLGGGRSLHGCLIRPHGVDGVVIMREVAAVAEPSASSSDRFETAGDGLWDGRFVIAETAPTDGAALGPVGEAGARHLAALEAEGAWTPPPTWRTAPRAARLTTPALWRGAALIAAPLAAYGDALSARFAPPPDFWPGGG